MARPVQMLRNNATLNHPSPFHPRYPHQDPNCIFNVVIFFFFFLKRDRPTEGRQGGQRIYLPAKNRILVYIAILFLDAIYIRMMSHANSIDLKIQYIRIFVYYPIPDVSS